MGDIMSRARQITVRNIHRYVEIGLNVAYFRKLRNLTQEELAEKAGISRSYLSAIEAPNIVKTFSLELLFDLADALNIEPCKLMEFKNIN